MAKKELSITTDSQKKQLITLLQGIIDGECAEMRNGIHEATTTGDLKDLSPSLIHTLRKAPEVREKAFGRLIEDLKQQQEPLTLAMFFSQFLKSFSNALPDSDPDKNLFNKEMKGFVSGGREEEALTKKASRSRGRKVYVEDDENSQMNRKLRIAAVFQAITGACDSFYEAATSKKPGNPIDPDYIRFRSEIAGYLDTSSHHGLQ